MDLPILLLDLPMNDTVDRLQIVAEHMINIFNRDELPFDNIPSQSLALAGQDDQTAPLFPPGVSLLNRLNDLFLSRKHTYL